jgi:3-methyl-2-oxobutanoate hydroxymethyltransferase
VLTAWDYPSARYIEKSGDVDIALVGDSLAMVACGYDSTTRLGLDEMLYHCRSVARGATTPFLLADMTFGTYQSSLDTAVDNAIRIIREGHMDAVKVEGGYEVVPLVERLTSVGVPVMAHVGLTPQRQTSLSGFRVQGKTSESALRIYRQALALERAGAFAIVLEAVPSPLAQFITSKLSIPSIGIGAGSGCSGQVLVTLDMLGGFDRFVPRFTKQYLDLSNQVSGAISKWASEVRQGIFPDEALHTYPMSQEEWDRFVTEAESQEPTNTGSSS